MGRNKPEKPKGDQKPPERPKADIRPAEANQPVTPEDRRKRIFKWLDGHGFPFEMRAAGVLHKADFLVEQSRYYTSPEGVPREIDIIATKMHVFMKDNKTEGLAEVKLVAECKSKPKNEHPWVAFTAPTDGVMHRLADQYCLMNEAARSAYRLSQENHRAAAPELLLFGERTAFGLRCAPIFNANESDDIAYEALLGLASAALSQLDPLVDADTTSIIIPVLAVRTPLYECWYGEDGNLNLEERKHVVLSWHRPTHPLGHSHMAIHIVQESGLVDFAKEAHALFSYFTDAASDDVLMATAIHAAKRRREQER
jgi:hypothetical protein